MTVFAGIAILVAVIAAIGLAIKNNRRENAGFPASRRGGK